MNRLLSEQVGVIAFKAGTATSTPLVTAYAKVAPNFRRGMLIAVLGDMAAETVDVQIWKGSDTSGTSGEVMKSATQLAAHATTSDNKVIIINVHSSEIDVDLPFIAGYCVTGSTTGGIVGLVLIAGDERWGPLASFDSSTVAEIVD
jgi:hypothetical protein